MRHDSHYVEDLSRGNKTVGRVISIEKLEPNPEQPRTEFGDLSELTSSIKQNGVLEPILVKPLDDSGRFMIIAGERRWRASNLAGLKEVPCIELNIDDQTVAEIALIENLQRKDLNIWEIADGLADLANRFGYTHDDIAKKIGKSRTTVTESMAIAGLPESIRQKCRQSGIRAKSTLVEISRQFNEEEMHKFLDQIVAGEVKSGNAPKKENTSKKKKPTDPKPSPPKVSPAAAKTGREIPANSFIYTARDTNFEIVIDFKELEDFNSKDILKALKEAFDSVKHGG
jgi:ParB family chromosome partitioning protein